MGDDIELNLSPSCYNCLSWSSDGELAIAAGDSVHLQLPQWKPKYVHPLFEKEKSTPWTSTKVRVNVFTNKEWKVGWPSGRDAFSIGAEQSLSTVAGLAWSHQGLGLHRRCVLAVLTSNLLLSFYEADGQRRTWSRVAVVNKALEKYFRAKAEQPNSEEKLRKTRIRSFAWCPPLKNDSKVEHDRPDVRWGEHLLTVTTDGNDIVLIRVRRNNSPGPTASQYSMDVVSHFTLHSVGINYNMVPAGSLWAEALQSKSRILHVACGPWIKRAQETNSDNAESRAILGSEALIAVVLGSNLHFLNVRASLVPGPNSTVSIKGELSYNPDVLSSKSKELDAINFTGPLAWIPIDTSRLLLATGYIGGRATFRFDPNAYENTIAQIKTKQNSIALYQRSFQENSYTSMGALYSQHNEPISGIVAPQSNDSIYLSTLGPFFEAVTLSTIDTPLEQNLVSAHPPPWADKMERYRQKYCVQYELGDMAVVRTWGLATVDGWTAVAFTIHPGDVLEYTTRAEEITTIIFTPPEPDAVFPKPADISNARIASRRDEIIHYTLSSASKVHWCDLRSARLLYAACVCAINSHYGEQHASNRPDFLNLAHQALKHLSSVFNLPITEELSYCDPEQLAGTGDGTNLLGATPKPASLLEGPGGWIFEKCQTCFRRRQENVALSWRDQNTTICENGHTWNRCALTFLAIQEPYISMFCSQCDMNVLSKDKGVSYTLGQNLSWKSLAGQQSQRPDQQHDDNNNNGQKENDAVEDQANGNGGETEFDRTELYDMLYDRYDTCAYCGGKYLDE